MSALPPLVYQPSPRLMQVLTALAMLGLLCWLSALPLAPARTWGNLLIAALYLLGLGLGAIMFIAADHILEGGWTVLFRRIPEAMGSLLPAAAPGIILILLAAPVLYPWMGQPVEGPTVTALREWWLSRPLFVVRSLLYLFIWIALAGRLLTLSRRQDTEGGTRLTALSTGQSALITVVFAVTIWLASMDWVMTLEPEWISTIFGVYNFAGLFLSAIAAITLLVVVLSQGGPLTGLVNANHYHDLGKLLFSFGCFWFYIWFSQYLIIWYAHLPEETAWFVPRVTGAWGSLMVVNLILNWAVPFLVLLSGTAKRNPKILFIVACAVLLGRWVDLYLMIGPPVYPGGAVVSYLEAGVLLGIVGVAGLVILRALSRHPLVPRQDPFLDESLQHQT